MKKIGLNKRIEAVKGCRKVGKKDMKWNDARPKMKVDPERYVSTPVTLFPFFCGIGDEMASADVVANRLCMRMASS